MLKNKPTKMYTGILAFMAWLGIALQFYTAIPAYLSKGRTMGGALLELFSYFTIQSNILVATCLTVIAFTPLQRLSFFKRPGVLTSAAVDISIVSLVYNLVLRQLWHPTGLAKLGDETVHLIVPVLFIIYWLTAVPKNTISSRDSLSWLWYPFLYLVYIIIRGALCGIYPYFFLDAGKAGYGKVGLNIFVLLLVFLGMSLLYVRIAHLMSRSEKKKG